MPGGRSMYFRQPVTMKSTPSAWTSIGPEPVRW